MLSCPLALVWIHFSFADTNGYMNPKEKPFHHVCWPLSFPAVYLEQKQSACKHYHELVLSDRGDLFWFYTVLQKKNLAAEKFCFTTALASGRVFSWRRGLPAVDFRSACVTITSTAPGKENLGVGCTMSDFPSSTIFQAVFEQPLAAPCNGRCNGCIRMFRWIKGKATCTCWLTQLNISSHTHSSYWCYYKHVFVEMM